MAMDETEAGMAVAVAGAKAGGSLRMGPVVVVLARAVPAMTGLRVAGESVEATGRRTHAAGVGDLTVAHGLIEEHVMTVADVLIEERGRSVVGRSAKGPVLGWFPRRAVARSRRSRLM